MILHVNWKPDGDNWSLVARVGTTGQLVVATVIRVDKEQECWQAQTGGEFPSYVLSPEAGKRLVEKSLRLEADLFEMG